MLIPVILSGGVGSRLWPISREQAPKLFMQLPDGQSLVQKAFLRASSLPEVSEVLTVCASNLWRQIEHTYQAVVGAGAVSRNFMLECCSRDTAAAVASASLWVSSRFGAAAQLLILPSDHLITPQSLFVEAVAEASSQANAGRIALFGIVPTRAETGYGYLECAGNRLISFVEKPELEKAREFYRAGNFLWNAGMFCFQAQVMLAEMKQHCPDILNLAEQSLLGAEQKKQGACQLVKLPKEFQKVPKCSIDYAVMEKTKVATVVASRFEWSDIGDWNTWGKLKPADRAGNHIEGEAITIEASNNIIVSSRVLAVLGLDNSVIIDTPDALLVAHRDKVQQVREVYNQLKAKHPQLVEHHQTIQRPWGSYTVLDQGSGFKVKRIEVLPQGKLSLQSHQHRSEHWTIVSGTATVTIDDKVLSLKPNQSCYINCGSIHRLENQEQDKVILIEVQSGSYLGEDDIVRYQDDYGRLES